MPYFYREKVAMCGEYFILSVPKVDSFVFFRGKPVPYGICIYCNYSGLGDKQLYLLQIVCDLFSYFLQ